MLQQGHAAATGMAQKTVSLRSLRSFSIPLPPLDEQKEIVAEIEGYQNEIKRLKAEIAAQEKNIQKAIAHVWGEEDETP